MSHTDQPPIIILGGGGHARVLADCLLLAGRRVLGFTDPTAQPKLAPDIGWLGDDNALDTYAPGSLELVNGIGSTDTTTRRRQVYEHWVGKGYRFATLQHPSALLSTLDVTLGQGGQHMAGSLVAPGVKLGNNVLLNSRAVLEHDCQVGDHSHIATGAIICGGCHIGSSVHIGAGATLIQGITIGNGAIIAAGSVVTKNVEPLTLVAGVPARLKRALNEQDLESHQRPT